MSQWSASALRVRLEDESPEARAAVAAAVADDSDALSRLLAWGHVDVVAAALDHGKLPREQDIALLERVCVEHGRVELAVRLAVHHGILLPQVLPRCAEVDVDDVPARMLSQTYGQGGQWTAQWIFFQGAPFLLPKAREDGLAILTRLRASALLPGDPEAQLDRTRIVHIPFPELPGMRRRSFVPRQDLVLDVAQRAGTSEIIVLRIVRARRRSGMVHAIR